MERCGLALVAACALSTGCTLLFDGSEFRGDSDGGIPIDDRISAPTIAITERPTTLDAIEVTILAPSVDADGGEVTYTYAWTRDGEGTAVTSDAVPPSRTAKGQAWEVTVTPRVEDRVGPSADASTEVINSPPVVGSVGFNTYRPRADDILRALPGAIYDPDGDAFTLQVRWERDGEEVATGPAASLNLASNGFEAGDEVRVEVVATDGDASEPVSNTVTVMPAHTAWRQLMPNRQASFEDFGFSIHDARNGRVVMYVDGQLWEYYLGTRNIDRVWVELSPSGTAPPSDLVGASTVYDPARGRVLIVGGGIDDGAVVNVSTIYTLDLARGAEAWGSFVAGGDPPEALFVSSLVVDDRRQRLLAYSTFPFEEGMPISDVLFQLDLQPGAEAWSRVSVTGDLPGFMAAPTWVLDPEQDVAYLAGGLRVDAVGMLGANEEVYRLDLTEGGESFTALSATLPVGTMGAAGGLDPVRRRAYFVHGMTAADGETPHDVIFALDLDGGETIAEVTPDDPLPGTALGQASWDAATGKLLILGMLGREGMRSYGIAALGEEGSWEALDLPGVSSPVPTAEPGYFLMDRGGASSLFVIGGRDAREGPLEGVYRFSFTQNAFERVSVEADPTHGSPPPGWGYGFLVGEDRLESRFLVGGADGGGPFAPVPVWRFERGSGADWRWRQTFLGAPDEQPTPREGAVVLTRQPACPPGSPELFYFGGMVGDSAVDDQLRHYYCSGLECYWVPGTHDATLGGRAYAGVNSYSEAGGIFGGLDASLVGTNTVWMPDGECDDGLTWSVNDNVADPPPGRFGHTYNLGEQGPEDQRFYVFGGKGSWDGDTYYNDVWEFTPWYMSPPYGAWAPVEPMAGPDYPHPAPRFHHAAAWDPSSRRLIVFGGEGEDRMPRSDVWELRGVQ
jgi:hypothetical protein